MGSKYGIKSGFGNMRLQSDEEKEKEQEKNEDLVTAAMMDNGIETSLLFSASAMF